MDPSLPRPRRRRSIHHHHCLNQMGLYCLSIHRHHSDCHCHHRRHTNLPNHPSHCLLDLDWKPLDSCHLHRQNHLRHCRLHLDPIRHRFRLHRASHHHHYQDWWGQYPDQLRHRHLHHLHHCLDSFHQFHMYRPHQSLLDHPSQSQPNLDPFPNQSQYCLKLHPRPYHLLNRQKAHSQVQPKKIHLLLGNRCKRKRFHQGSTPLH